MLDCATTLEGPSPRACSLLVLALVVGACAPDPSPDAAERDLPPGCEDYDPTDNTIPTRPGDWEEFTVLDDTSYEDAGIADVPELRRPEQLIDEADFVAVLTPTSGDRSTEVIGEYEVRAQPLEVIATLDGAVEAGDELDVQRQLIGATDELEAEFEESARCSDREEPYTVEPGPGVDFVPGHAYLLGLVGDPDRDDALAISNGGEAFFPLVGADGGADLDEPGRLEIAPPSDDVDDDAEPPLRATWAERSIDDVRESLDTAR